MKLTAECLYSLKSYDWDASGFNIIKPIFNSGILLVTSATIYPRASFIVTDRIELWMV